MRKLDKTDLILVIVSLVVGVWIGLHLLLVYDSYEYNLNPSNPLILDNDFVLCKTDLSSFYAEIHNLNGKEVDWEDKENLCNRKNLETLRYKYKENITIYNHRYIDDFFSGQEEEVETHLSNYSLTKLRVEGYEKTIIRVTDKGRGKNPLWE